MTYDEYESSNRTFMELKYAKIAEENGVECCSNRTFMELKCMNRRIIGRKVAIVLIAPLWN